MSKTFLSVASGPDIGLATARRFGREGYRVVLAARNVARLQTDAAKLRAEGIEATTVQVDATDARSVANVVTSIRRRSSPQEPQRFPAGVLDA
jgi:NAD(P)-dependent dehydrogenase (short-subunit alcohol dehydrogenase family)